MFSEKFINKRVRIQYMVGSSANEVIGHLVEEDQNFIYLQENGQCIRCDSVITVSEVAEESTESKKSFSLQGLNELIKGIGPHQVKIPEPQLSKEEQERAKAIAEAVSDFKEKNVEFQPTEKEPNHHGQYTISDSSPKNFKSIRSEANIRKDEERKRRMEEQAKKLEEEALKRAMEEAEKLSRIHVPTVVGLQTIVNNSFEVIRSPENIAKEEEAKRLAEEAKRLADESAKESVIENSEIKPVHIPSVVNLSTVSSSSFNVIRSPENVAKDEAKKQMEIEAAQRTVKEENASESSTQAQVDVEQDNKSRRIKYQSFQLNNFTVKKHKKAKTEVQTNAEPVVNAISTFIDETHESVSKFNNVSVAFGGSVAI